MDAASRGDVQAALDLAPVQARPRVQAVLDEAIAEGGSAVLLTSGALAVATTLIVLVLINTKNVPGPTRWSLSASGAKS